MSFTAALLFGCMLNDAIGKQCGVQLVEPLQTQQGIGGTLSGRKDGGCEWDASTKGRRQDTLK